MSSVRFFLVFRNSKEHLELLSCQSQLIMETNVNKKKPKRNYLLITIWRNFLFIVNMVISFCHFLYGQHSRPLLICFYIFFYPIFLSGIINTFTSVVSIRFIICFTKGVMHVDFCLKITKKVNFFINFHLFFL